MPKLKTKSAAKKRFKVLGTGKIKMKSANSRHRLISKPKSMKRKAKGMELVNASDVMRIVSYFLPYAKKRRMRTARNEAQASVSKEA